jgi:hypothetical protein
LAVARQETVLAHPSTTEGEMATCPREASPLTLELPPAFEDLEGLVRADLHAIVTMLTERAHERLFLTRRQHRQLQGELWNRLTEVLNETLEPLSAEYR